MMDDIYKRQIEAMRNSNQAKLSLKPIYPDVLKTVSSRNKMHIIGSHVITICGHNYLNWGPPIEADIAWPPDNEITKTAFLEPNSDYCKACQKVLKQDLLRGNDS